MPTSRHVAPIEAPAARSISFPQECRAAAPSPWRGRAWATRFASTGSPEASRLSQKSCSNGAAGFTLIEALVALAIVAAVLGTIGTVIATTVKGTRSIEQRLALDGTAEQVIAALPARALLTPG